MGVVFTIIFIVALVLVGLYFLGNKLMKKQNEAQQVIRQNRQTVSARQALESVPGYMKIRKLPMAKVKVGPQITTMLCDPKVFKTLPVKKVVKIEIAGAYILGFSTAKKGEKKVERPHKLTFREKIANKANALSEQKAKLDKKSKNSKTSKK